MDVKAYCRVRILVIPVRSQRGDSVGADPRVCPSGGARAGARRTGRYYLFEYESVSGLDYAPLHLRTEPDAQPNIEAVDAATKGLSSQMHSFSVGHENLQKSVSCGVIQIRAGAENLIWSDTDSLSKDRILCGDGSPAKSVQSPAWPNMRGKMCIPVSSPCRANAD